MTTETARYSLSHIRYLEAESIHVMREVAAEFERPVLLYSIRKDSSVLLRLAQRAFQPGKIPFPLMHVDTGYKFTEMYEFRDWYVKEIGAELIVWRNEAAIENGANPFDLGTQKCCGLLKTDGLLTGLRHHRFDAAIGGAHRDEEKSRAKERFFSFRDQLGQWDPKNQRPELWSLYNARVSPDASIRVFPLSNWTELDVWQYISTSTSVHLHRENSGQSPLLRPGAGSSRPGWSDHLPRRAARPRPALRTEGHGKGGADPLPLP